MNERQPTTPELIASHLKLKIELTPELPPNVGADLDNRPNPAYIVVNEKLPPYEQTFSVYHQIGRLLFSKKPFVLPHYIQRLINRRYISRFMKVWVRIYRRWIYKNLGPDKQNSIVALCFMCRFGHSEELKQFLEKHPEMTGWAIYCGLGMRFLHTKRQIKSFFRRLFGLNRAIL